MENRGQIFKLGHGLAPLDSRLSNILLLFLSDLGKCSMVQDLHSALTRICFLIFHPLCAQSRSLRLSLPLPFHLEDHMVPAVLVPVHMHLVFTADTLDT